MLPIASVKFLAAHEPERSMPSGFGSACANTRRLVAAAMPIAALILGHTVSSSSCSRHIKHVRGRPRYPHERSRKCHQPAEHGVGAHADPSGCFLNCDEMMYGVSRFTGSSTTAVQTISAAPSGSLNKSMYSRSEAFSPYGTPFL